MKLCTTQQLRAAGIVAEIGYRGNLKRRMERANRANARAAIIVGETERLREVFRIRFLDAGLELELRAIGSDKLLSLIRQTHNTIQFQKIIDRAKSIDGLQIEQALVRGMSATV
ncbi:hypothetical protein J4558_27675 [Leptolyngbya sp. 15MV]|nr:hypothetical protein J4558_27675 [Leptolyngbya sp. 15MV]